jgi:hypothetical protein
MTGREKIEAALSPDGAREIPVVICYEEIMIRDHWAEVTEAPWWHMGAQDVEKQIAWRSAYHEKVGADWFMTCGIAPTEHRKHERVDPRDDGAFFIDGRTGAKRWVPRPVVGGWRPERGLASNRPKDPPLTREAIDAAIPVETFDAGRYAVEGRADMARELLRRFGAGRLPFAHVTSPAWNGYELWGFETWMTLVAERPDLVRYSCGRSLDAARSLVDEHAACGARAIFVEECMTDMMSPQAFRELVAPYARGLIDYVRGRGLASIYYYCGNPAGKWDMLLDAGADALSLEESKKGWTIDIDEVVGRADGRCAVLGNLDAMNLLPRAGEPELRAEIARQIAAGRRNGSRFIMSIGSPVTPGTPLERVRLYCDLARELGAR